jgi:hypothetical protein
MLVTLSVDRLRGESDVKIVEIIGIAKSVVKLFYNDGVVGGLVCPVICRYWTETVIPSHSPTDINIVYQASISQGQFYDANIGALL